MAETWKNPHTPMMCLHTNRKLYVACNFSCRFVAQGLVKVTGSHVDCKSGNVSETVQCTDGC